MIGITNAYRFRDFSPIKDISVDPSVLSATESKPGPGNNITTLFKT